MAKTAQLYKIALYAYLGISLSFCGSFLPAQTSQISLTIPPTLTRAPDTIPTPEKTLAAEQVNSRVFLPAVTQFCGNCYYVDSLSGSDSNSGTSQDHPWNSLRMVNQTRFQPGSKVLFKRGSSWVGQLDISASGKPGAPITFSAYGSGPAPLIILNPTLKPSGGPNPFTPGSVTSAIRVQNSWVVINGFHIEKAVIGVELLENAQYNIVQGNEIDTTGIAIGISGHHNLVTKNYIHDLQMVVNTPGGNDDYGAIGVDVLGPSNEISYNRLVNCEAFSYDYGIDGGAFEIYQNGDNTYVHHNWSMNTEGFMEVSSNGSGSARNVTISYNVILNSTGLNDIHVSNQFATQIDNFKVENNTFVDLRSHDPRRGSVVWFGGTPPAGAYTLRNNIIMLKDYWWVVSSNIPFNHSNNLYYFLNTDTHLGFSLGTGERIADPQFVNLSGNDFHLKPSSPAIDSGMYLGSNLDFDGSPVPYNGATDIGAYEFHGVQ